MPAAWEVYGPAFRIDASWGRYHFLLAGVSRPEGAGGAIRARVLWPAFYREERIFAGAHPDGADRAWDYEFPVSDCGPWQRGRLAAEKPAECGVHGRAPRPRSRPGLRQHGFVCVSFSHRYF